MHYYKCTELKSIFPASVVLDSAVISTPSTVMQCISLTLHHMIPLVYHLHLRPLALPSSPPQELFPLEPHLERPCIHPQMHQDHPPCLWCTTLKKRCTPAPPARRAHAIYYFPLPKQYMFHSLLLHPNFCNWSELAWEAIFGEVPWCSSMPQVPSRHIRYSTVHSDTHRVFHSLGPLSNCIRRNEQMLFDTPFDRPSFQHILLPSSITRPFVICKSLFALFAMTFSTY